MAACGQQDDCEDCVQVIRDTKTVEVPCTRNTYQQYTVQVPRKVTEKVPRTVTYTEYETREKQVPYTVNRSEMRTRMETQKYQVPVTKYYKKTVMETRTRQVPVPYYVNVPETKYRTVTEQVPVQKSKVEMDNVVKTVYESQTKVRCVPETKMVTKEIPVYNVIPRPAPPCPPGIDCGVDAKDDYKVGDHRTNDQVQFNSTENVSRADTHMNQIPYEEHNTARATGNLSKSVLPEPTYRE